ncbi:recombinase family protein [Microbacterium sp. 1.5R]|uniref:recombinase family protein n=1 Tax=Microbacterium sp. 1.5R TaxID=1916917 RepID=UPI001642D55F|nr:recombinase family protein [Microbacterium sp. 1.5R]
MEEQHRSAWIYTRLSEDKKKGTEKEGATVARQERDCRQWADNNGIIVLGVKKDNDVSATRSKYRKGFEQLLRENPPGIIVWHQDRLLRKTKDLERIIELGIPVYSVTSGVLDLSTPQGRAIARTVATWSTYEGEHRDERQGAALDEIHANREPVPGKRRFGYLAADEKAGRRVNCKKHPVEAPIVKAMFESMADPDPDQRRSINSWAEELGWRRTRVRETLTNKAYMGILTRRGVEFEAAKHVDRLVSKEIFETVQNHLATHLHARRPGGVIRHLASGIARCGVCGGPMSYRNAYLCLANLSHPCIKGDWVDKKIRFEIASYLVGSMRDPRIVPPRLSEIERRLPLIDVEEAEWAEAKAGGMRWSLIAPHVEALLTERERLLSERTALLAASTRASILSDLRRAVVEPATHRVDWDAAGALLREVQRRFDARSIEDQRALIAAHFEIVIHPGRGPSRIAVISKDEEI